jgi:hypothetical protein
MRIWIQLFTPMRIRIKLPKIMRIRIRNPAKYTGIPYVIGSLKCVFRDVGSISFQFYGLQGL